MRRPFFRRREASGPPAVQDQPPAHPGRERRLRDSLYMTLWTFLVSVILTAGLMAAAAYGFLVFFGILVNPLYRVLAMPTLLMVFILTLAAGLGRSKLKPMNDLVHAMHAVSRGDFSVRVDTQGVSGDMGDHHVAAVSLDQLFAVPDQSFAGSLSRHTHKNVLHLSPPPAAAAKSLMAAAPS